MENNVNTPNSKAPLVAAGILGLAVVGGIVAWAFGIGKTTTTEVVTTEPTPTENQDTTNTQNTGTAPAQTGAYKDGTYTQKGAYTSPAGPESVDVSLTIANDIITNASFKGEAVNPVSIKLQTAFAQGYRQMVVGKKIDELKLDVVNGASLTSAGFMDAVAKIKTQAQS